jgi:hypothetical protein
MGGSSVTASKRAFGRSRADFLPLWPAEEILLEACRKGEFAILGDTLPSPQDQNKQALKVRADFLRFLLLGGDEQAPVHERGVQLRGAWIEGKLDLTDCLVPSSMWLLRCCFTEELIARDAQIHGTLSLQGSELTHGLRADRLNCAGGVFLRGRFKALGQVRLNGAQIGGDLSCNGGQFDSNEGFSLSSDGAVIKGSVLLSNGFDAKGEVGLLAAQIGGNLDCHGGKFDGKEGFALSADGAVIKGDVFLNEAFKVIGTVRLPGSQIGGNLDCNGGHFDGKGHFALLAERAVVKGRVFLGHGFNAKWEVSLLGAQIGGDLACNSGRFDGKERDALLADDAVIKGNVFLDEGFRAQGTVRLLGAQIGGNLVCKDGQFDGKESYALSADRAIVKGNVFLNEGFKAQGTVRLPGAQIGGDLACVEGQFDGKGGDALSLQAAQVAGALILRQTPESLRVDAGHAQVGVLVDDVSAWAKSSIIDGFRYGAFGGGASTSATDRLEWLYQQDAKHLGESKEGKDFRPQPWRQLQSVLRETGHAEEARQVGIAFEDQLRKIGWIGTTAPGTWKPLAICKKYTASAFHGLFGKLAGYGYRPMRLMAWMAGVWLLCGALFWLLALPPHNALGPSDPLVFQNKDYGHCVPDSDEAKQAKAAGNAQAGNWYLCAKLPAEYSTFSPLVYSLDIILPLVDLGQEKAWGPLVQTPKAAWWQELGAFTPGHLARCLLWFETLFGWVASLLLVGIVSGFARRTEE